jgi:ketosteroid isomerase-like protein
MRTRSLVLGLMAVVLTVATGAAQQTAASADDQAVIAAEHQWLKAEQTNSPELIAQLSADKIAETSEDGEVLYGKDAVVADAKTDHWSSADYKSLKVTVFGNTAIATGVFVGKGTSGGTPIDAHVAFTDTWMKQANGKWLCVAAQDSPIKK